MSQHLEHLHCLLKLPKNKLLHFPFEEGNRPEKFVRKTTLYEFSVYSTVEFLYEKKILTMSE